MPQNLLGAQPRHLTGKRFPDYADPHASERASASAEAFKTIWIDHGPQLAIISRVLKLHRDSIGRKGQPLGGLRLSQDSQAGKSATFARIKKLLADQRSASGLEPNPYQVLIVGLDKKTSLKSVFQDVLLAMHDPDWSVGTEKVLRVRIDEFVQKLGVELLVVDEIQHLKREGNDVRDVTDALKRWLDTGSVPLALVGNLDSKPFFERNQQLCARLGVALDLSPLDAARQRDAVYFKTFCAKFDEELARSGATLTKASLEEPHLLDGLLAASGGHVGRVARLLEHAVDHTSWRGAVTVEPYDLSSVVRSFAIPMRWVDHDPFALDLGR